MRRCDSRRADTDSGRSTTATTHWTIRVLREPHECMLPDARRFERGTLIRCGGCGKRYKRSVDHLDIMPSKPVWVRRFLPWPR